MSLEKVKSRSVSKVIHHPSIERKRSGVWKTEGTPRDSTWNGKQITASSGHRRGRGGIYHAGGPLFTTRTTFDIKSRVVKSEGVEGGIPTRYIGPIHIPVPTTQSGSVATENRDDSYLDPIGATAIRLVDPTNENAQFGQVLGEFLLERGLPAPAIQAWERRTKAAKAAGSEYLSAAFGWLPLVREMKNTAQSVKDGNLIMTRYRDGSGSLQHRTFEFDDITSESETVVDLAARCVYAPQANYPALNSAGVPLILKQKNLTKRWFSGAFTYTSGSNTDIEKCLGIGAEADKLFGLALTPEIIWELTPWSWAIDWFSNTGTVIHNATSLGLSGLVMKYGYVMEETSSTYEYSMPATGLKGVTGSPPSCVVTKVTKRRRPANPFGFGIGWEGLSPTQLAITAALGITRL